MDEEPGSHDTQNTIKGGTKGTTIQAGNTGDISIYVGRPGRSQIGRYVGCAVDRLRQAPRRAVIAAGVLLLVVIACAVSFVVLLCGQGGPSIADLDRVPVALRADCRLAAADSGFAGASRVLSCTAGGQVVQFSLFDQAPTLDSDYDGAISKSGVPSGSGDCTISPDAEHRYPSEGTGTGRVLCYQHDGVTTFVWSNYQERTLAQIDQPNLDTSLGSSWAGWVGLPAFPTRDETALANLVDAKGCQRPAAGSLEPLDSLNAAITCPSPGTGVHTISYFSFGNDGALTQAQSEQQATVGAPSGVDCSETPRGFLGETLLDLRGADVGSVLCYLGAGNAPTLQWTLAPLRLMIRATGTTPSALMSWWQQDFGFAPPTTALINAVNAQGQPSFPTRQESSLLSRIPPASRIGCMRLSPEQITENIGHIPATAITCGPTQGASIVFYYQFSNSASMAAAASENEISHAFSSGPGCTASTPRFTGAAAYDIGSRTGVLRCGENSNHPYLIWSDDRYNVIGMAFFGAAPGTLLDWWRHQAGPQ